MLVLTMFGNAAAALEQLKKYSGLTWKAIAVRSGIALRTLNAWKSGEPNAPEPGLTAFGRIARACGVYDLRQLAELLSPRLPPDEVREPTGTPLDFNAGHTASYYRGLSEAYARVASALEAAEQRGRKGPPEEEE